MKKTTLLIACITCANFLLAQKTINCLIKTSLGDISIELYADKAPVTVANFLRYVDAHLYDSSSFFSCSTFGQPAK